MTAQPALDSRPASRPSHWHRHGSLGTTLVAALYVVLVVASPLLVRFAPMPEQAVVAQARVVDPAADPRCATAPEFAIPCAGRAHGK